MRLIGQVVKLDRGFPLVCLDSGEEVRCKHATALVKGKKVRAVIGDKVVLEVADDADMAQIAEILPRRNSLVRKDPTERALPQTLAANFDTVIVAHPLAELNLNRLERELVLAHETGARVAVVLTKADLAEDRQQLDESTRLVRQVVADTVSVAVVSENDAESIERVRELIPEQSTAVLIGRSGVGKSSLVNLLAGAQVQETTPVRESDGKGRHTTVSRSMIEVRGGGRVVDMPGVRGLGLWKSDEGIAAAFPDITELSQQCRFRDCQHINEPGCAVLAAVAAGRIPQPRLDCYVQLMAENRAQDVKREEAKRMRERTGHPRRRP